MEWDQGKDLAGTQSQESKSARPNPIEPSSAVQLSRKKNILTLFGQFAIVGLMDGQDGCIFEHLQESSFSAPRNMRKSPMVYPATKF